MNEKEAIKKLKHKNLYINIKPKSSICIDCINENKNKHIEAEVVINEELELAIETVLNLLEKKDKEIQFQKEINKIEQNRHKQTEKSLKGQLKKKDKMIDLMGEKIFEEGIVWENKEDVKQYFERKVENGN